MMIGFVVPLYIICGLESFLAFLLMLPLPFCLPAVKLCRFSKKNTVARTVINTSAAFLLVLLVAPLYDTFVMKRAKEEASQATPESLAKTSAGEVQSQLSASLTAAAIGNLFLLRHLGSCIDEREELRAQLKAHNIADPSEERKRIANDDSDVPLKAE